MTTFVFSSDRVCSTHVEMFLRRCLRSPALRSLLHACGDVSVYTFRPLVLDASAPRMWRCFFSGTSRNAYCRVCSTHVEMFLREYLIERSLKRLLHACGDVSSFNSCPAGVARSAPRMWRCFQGPTRRLDAEVVCSTHVEMFLLCLSRHPAGRGLLHACGDVSTRPASSARRHPSAPRMWRCF